jgi:hypothetical protein
LFLVEGEGRMVGLHSDSYSLGPWEPTSLLPETKKKKGRKEERKEVACTCPETLSCIMDPRAAVYPWPSLIRLLFPNYFITKR